MRTTAVAIAWACAACSPEPAADAGTTGSTGAGDESSDEGDPPRDNGEFCVQATDCASGKCFDFVLGGVCSECASDEDCTWGCDWWGTAQADPAPGAVCDDGTAAAACESDAACEDGLRCGDLITVFGFPPLRTCGTCVDDRGCADGQLCAPDFSPAQMGGRLRCVASASLPLGAACPLGPSGDAACTSGLCEEADVLGLLVLGVCSSCSVVEGRDDPCPALTSFCEPPIIVDDEIAPGHCA